MVPTINHQGAIMETKSDSSDNIHVYPTYENCDGPEHELWPWCWCFPQVRKRDNKGQKLDKTLYVHRIFPKRGNS